MKFQGSELERNYNDYWNETIIPMDHKIEMTITKIVRGNYSDTEVFQIIDQLLSEYTDTISDLITNIQTNTKDFEDDSYINQYIEDITKQFSEDVSQYETNLNRSKNNTEILTYGFGQFFSKINRQTSHSDTVPYIPLKLEPLFNLGDGIDPFNPSLINDFEL